MDFKTLATSELCDKPSTLEVVNPATGETIMHDGKPVTVSVKGSEGATYQRLQAEEAGNMISKVARNRRLRTGDNTALRLAAGCTTAWYGIQWDGRELPCTEKNAEMLYGKCPWLLDQVLAHMQSVEHYLGN